MQAPLHFQGSETLGVAAVAGEETGGSGKDCCSDLYKYVPFRALKDTKSLCTLLTHRSKQLCEVVIIVMIIAVIVVQRP